MASAMRKMAVYLGLVEDDHRYDDQYQDEYGAEEYDEYGAEFIDAGEPREVAGHAGRGPGAGRPPGDRQPAAADADHGSGPDHHIASAHVQ